MEVLEGMKIETEEEKFISIPTFFVSKQVIYFFDVENLKVSVKVT